MAVGDYWDVSTVAPNGVDAPSVDAPPDEQAGDIADELLAIERKPRLSVAKVSAAEAKHRGVGRARAVAERHAGIALGELDDVDEALRRRHALLIAAIKRTQDLYIVNDQRQVFRLAAADLFVEKAQLSLGQQARSMWRSGIATTVAAVALLIGLSALLVWRGHAFSTPSLTGTQLTVVLVEMIATTAVVLFAVRHLIKLSGSFFQQNVSTVAKQHALGFGRLYVYTNPDAIRLKDLQDAFGLDLDLTPIFLDIKTKETADTIYSKLTQDLGPAAGR
jgi:hypothetical protein